MGFKYSKVLVISGRGYRNDNKHTHSTFQSGSKRVIRKNKQKKEQPQSESYQSDRVLWRKLGFHVDKNISGKFREAEQTGDSCKT